MRWSRRPWRAARAERGETCSSAEAWDGDDVDVDEDDGGLESELQVENGREEADGVTACGEDEEEDEERDKGEEEGGKETSVAEVRRSRRALAWAWTRRGVLTVVRVLVLVRALARAGAGEGETCGVGSGGTAAPAQATGSGRVSTADSDVRALVQRVRPDDRHRPAASRRVGGLAWAGMARAAGE